MTDVASTKKQGFGILGLGAAACAACCAGPALGLLGGLGIAGVVGAVVTGAVGLLAIALVIGGYVVMRRRRSVGTVPDVLSQPVTLGRKPSSIPIHDATVPITCTIGADEVPDRIALIERLRAGLEGIERTEHGLLLHLRPEAEVEADARRFAVDEKRCCQFWGFAVERGADLTLRWDGPPDADELLDRLFAYFEGDEPLTALDGLL